jgi:hypothetical protein
MPLRVVRTTENHDVGSAAFHRRIESGKPVRAHDDSGWELAVR